MITKVTKTCWWRMICDWTYLWRSICWFIIQVNSILYCTDMEYIKVYINSICSLKVSHVGWLYTRGKGTVLTPCTESKISCLSIICCPNLQMMSRIFKHTTRMVGLCQGRHYFSSTRKDNLGIIMGVWRPTLDSLDAPWKTSYHPHKSAITEYNINQSHYIQLHKTNIPAKNPDTCTM